MKTVLIESPLEFGTERHEENLVYAKRCLNDSLLRGEAPYMSHLLYPGTLDDRIPEQRQRGMGAGWAIGARLEAWIFYLDRGVTKGMLEGVDAAVAAGFRPYYEPAQPFSILPPYDKPILFRTFNLEGSGMYRVADGTQREASEIMLHECVRWPLLLAQFEKHARREWDLPR
jgi:hypothetical protein